eukprot:1147905-Pelagomonas_calceolata.AAC.3
MRHAMCSRCCAHLRRATHVVGRRPVRSRIRMQGVYSLAFAGIRVHTREACRKVGMWRHSSIFKFAQMSAPGLRLL